MTQPRIALGSMGLPLLAGILVLMGIFAPASAADTTRVEAEAQPLILPARRESVARLQGGRALLRLQAGLSPPQNFECSSIWSPEDWLGIGEGARPLAPMPLGVRDGGS